MKALILILLGCFFFGCKRGAPSLHIDTTDQSWVEVHGVISDGHLKNWPFVVKSGDISYGLDVESLPPEIIGKRHHVRGRVFMQNGVPGRLTNGSMVLTSVTIDGIRYQSKAEWVRDNPPPPEAEDPFSPNYHGSQGPFK